MVIKARDENVDGELNSFVRDVKSGGIGSMMDARVKFQKYLDCLKQ